MKKFTLFVLYLLFSASASGEQTGDTYLFCKGGFGPPKNYKDVYIRLKKAENDGEGIDKLYMGFSRNTVPPCYHPPVSSISVISVRQIIKSISIFPNMLISNNPNTINNSRIFQNR